MIGCAPPPIPNEEARVSQSISSRCPKKKVNGRERWGERSWGRRAFPTGQPSLLNMNQEGLSLLAIAPPSSTLQSKRTFQTSQQMQLGSQLCRRDAGLMEPTSLSKTFQTHPNLLRPCVLCAHHYRHHHCHHCCVQRHHCHRQCRRLHHRSSRSSRNQGWLACSSTTTAGSLPPDAGPK